MSNIRVFAIVMFLSIDGFAALTALKGQVPSCPNHIATLTYPEFQKRVVIVTGGSSGIGLKTAELLAASGARVVIFDLKPPEGPIEAIGSIYFQTVNVADEASLRVGFEEVAREFSRIDAVAANAGVHASGTVLDTKLSEFDDVMNVNLRGTFLTLQESVNRMSEQSPDPLWGRGSVVVTGSDQSLIGKPRSFAYGISKSALTGMVRSSALAVIELGIRVNLVCPGSTDTPFLDDAVLNHSGRYQLPAEGMKTAWGAAVPGGRLITPEEVAQSIVFLLSPRSTGTTGAVIAVDRGATAQ